MNEDRKTTGRREFFRGVGRWGIMGGITALCAWAAGAPRASQSSGQVCTRTPVCRGCPLLPGCTLPRAKAERRIDPNFSGRRSGADG